ncbi:MAG: acyltransferase family protein, partial [Treponemataceae bacterium]|nr:acyltransferase family protein [Treponemataceae bacterium]
MEIQASKPLIGRETSRRITSLRFLLAVFVVFIHNNFTAKSVAEAFQETGVQTAFCQNAFGKWTQLFISDGIARCAVPLFFLFAAYLAARKDDSYPVMLRKKAKSLALPFVL